MALLHKSLGLRKTKADAFSVNLSLQISVVRTEIAARSRRTSRQARKTLESKEL